MKGIITVIGKDNVGIIAKVCSYLADNDVNILDISQTVVSDYLNMMMIVDLTNTIDIFDKITEELINVGKSIGVVVRLQHEDIFNTMHRI